MKRKLKRGDVFRFTNIPALNPEFVKRWGTGPFVITRKSISGYKGGYDFATPSGEDVSRPPEHTAEDHIRNWWIEDDDLEDCFIQVDEFLTRVYADHRRNAKKAQPVGSS